MTLKPDNIDRSHAKAAAAALDAYELHGTPANTSPRHRHDHRQARYLLSELLHDLMHYAAHVGLDAEQELSGIRHAIAHANGEPVHHVADTVDDGLHRGWVTNLHFNTPDQRQYDVQFLGEPETRRIDGAELTATHFPDVRIGPDTLPNPQRAVELLVATQGRMRARTAHGQEPHRPDNDDSQAILSVLATWGRTTEEAILNALDERISTTAREFQRYVPRSPTELAGRDFPQSDESMTSTSSAPFIAQRSPEAQPSPLSPRDGHGRHP